MFGKIMKFKDYFDDIKIKTDKMDKRAKNPFIEYDYSYNPFKGAFKQTYVWIEKERKKED